MKKCFFQRKCLQSIDVFLPFAFREGPSQRFHSPLKEVHCPKPRFRCIRVNDGFFLSSLITQLNSWGFEEG